MNYRKWLIEDLQNLERHRYSIHQMEKELEAIEAEYTAIKATNYDKMPTVSGENLQEDKMLSAIARRDEVSKNLEATKRHVELMDGLLDQLSSDEQRVIVVMFVKHEKYGHEMLSVELGYEKSQIYDIRGRALTHLAQLRWGVGYQP